MNSMHLSREVRKQVGNTYKYVDKKVASFNQQLENLMLDAQIKYNNTTTTTTTTNNNNNNNKINLLLLQLREINNRVTKQVYMIKKRISDLEEMQLKQLNRESYSGLNTFIIVQKEQINSEILSILPKLTSISIPTVYLEWYQDAAQNHTYRIIEETHGYSHRKAAQMQACKSDCPNSNLSEPYGIAIDEANGYIYATDREADRVQVFDDEGVHVKEIKCIELAKPWSVCVMVDAIYVVCSELGMNFSSLLKFSKSNFEFVKAANFRYRLRGMDYDSEHNIYMAELAKCSITVCDSNLNFTKKIQLCCLLGTKWLRDVKIGLYCIYALFSNKQAPIQTFSRDGQFIRNLITEPQLILFANFFCLDQSENIIISDTNANQITIFNQDGHLINTSGGDKMQTNRKSKEKMDVDVGVTSSNSPQSLEFNSPNGIACAKLQQRVVVAGLKGSYRLFAF